MRWRPVHADTHADAPADSDTHEHRNILWGHAVHSDADTDPNATLWSNRDAVLQRSLQSLSDDP